MLSSKILKLNFSIKKGKSSLISRELLTVAGSVCDHFRVISFFGGGHFL